MKIKKLITSIIFLLATLEYTNAQAPFTFFYRPDFLEGYPMVTSVEDWYIAPDDDVKDNAEPFQIFDFILSVNGKDVNMDNGMDEFFKTTNPIFKVKYLRWPDKVCEFTFDNLLLNNSHEVGDMHSLHPMKVVPLYKTDIPDMNIVKAKNIDFAHYKTYDFLLDGNDRLLDEELLSTFINSPLSKHMKRDTEDPDVIFRIAKNLNESIDNTYIPPTKDLPTTHHPVNNYIARIEANQDTRFHRNVGVVDNSDSTKSNIYLEVVALDARRLNELGQNTPPEIWKMIYSTDKIKNDSSVVERYKDILSFCAYPFQGQCPLMHGAILYTGASLEPSFDKTMLEVRSVVPYSPAANLGLQAGDKILKINGKNEFLRRDLSKDGTALQELVVPIGELETQLAQSAYLIFKLDMDRDKDEKACAFGGITFKNLHSDKDNEYLVERAKNHIKLKGHLWDPEFYEMDADTFREWCINNNIFSYVLVPQ